MQAGVYFEGKSFRGVNLRGRDWRGAHLYNCDFSDADLAGIWMQGAKIHLPRRKAYRCNL